VDLLERSQNNISGPAVTFKVDSCTAARSGFTPEEVSTDATAILAGAEAAAPVILNDRAYPIRVRMPEQDRASLDRMQNTLLVSATGRTATLGTLSTIALDPGQTEIRRENLQRLVEVTGRLEGVDLGRGVTAVKKAVADLNLPSSIRVEYGGTYAEQQKPLGDLLRVLFLFLVFSFWVFVLN